MNQLIKGRGKRFACLIWSFWVPLLFGFAYLMTRHYEGIEAMYRIPILILFVLLLWILLLGTGFISSQIEKRTLYRNDTFVQILTRFLFGFLLPLSVSLALLVLLDLCLEKMLSASRHLEENCYILIVFLYLTNLFYLILYNDRKGSGELIAIRPERPPKRLFVHHQGHILPIDLMDIALIYQEHQINWLINFDGQSYAMETSLKQVQKELDGQRFFQINRWQIVNRENIRSLKSGTFGKIEVEFRVNFMKGTVSKGRASEFRKWLCM